jgi:hypothetical protein
MSVTYIRQALLANPVQTRETALEIAHYACSSRKRFAALMECFLSDEYKLVQRAAWSVGWAGKQQPAMIAPYLAQLVSQLQRKEVHPAVVRNCARILQETTIPEQYQGQVMNACFELITTPITPAAIKAFSLTILYNLSLQYPDIQPELQLIIEEQWEKETAAFRSRGRKILQKITRHTSKNPTSKNPTS